MNEISFISLMPNLVNEAGHDFVYHRCLEEIHQELGIPFEALVPYNANIHLPKQWKRFFRKKKDRFFDFSKAFLSRKKKEARVFFIESFNLVDFFCLTLAACLFAKSSDTVWVFFRNGKNQLYRRGKIHGWLAKLLRYRLRKRFIGLTDSELVQQSFASDLSLMVMPIPHTEHFEESAAEKKGTVLWWPGVPRPSKGLAEIQHFAQSTAPSGWELVVTQSAPLPEKTEVPIRRIADVLSREEYIRQLEEADFILLPYDPGIYATGTSGILVEAIIAGKIPIVREGTWLSHELKRFSLDDLIVDWTRPNLGELLSSLKGNEKVQTGLKKMREEYARFHNLESYREKIAAMLLDYP